MERAIPILVVIIIGAGWQMFVYRLSGRRAWDPLWLAFSTTAAALVFVIAGAIGYALDPHDRFVTHTAWTRAIIWRQIAVGLAMAVVAGYCWRKSLRHARLR